jgi:uncharacterized damage-inducible protein DinB
MAIRDSLLPEFDHEMALARKVIERVDPAQFGWKPHEKSMTLGRLATHVAEIPAWGQTILNDAEFDIGTSDYSPRSLASVDEILAALDANVKKVRALLEAKADGELLGTWTLKNKGTTVFGMPRVTAFRSWVMNHVIHHRGQLTVYLRQTGSPVPSIYGPSADESN